MRKAQEEVAIERDNEDKLYVIRHVPNELIQQTRNVARATARNQTSTAKASKQLERVEEQQQQRIR